MARKKKEMTFESNLDYVIPKIEEAPHKVLNIIGQQIVRETKPQVPKLSGILRKSLQYFARKRERDLQIGFKVFYAPFVYKHDDPIKPVVLKNKDLIQELIAKALKEINTKR